MNKEKAQNLVNQVSTLLKSYEKIAKSTGENFNIFSVMGMESDEVKTHSRIIAELLNPKGSHNQGSAFLKMFFQKIEIEIFDFDNAHVFVEEHVGTIDKEYSEGGFIDIVIKDSKNQVVIENKIYAQDQKGQLLRYKNKYPSCKLIYLTLDGKKPSEFSYKIGNKKDLKLEEIMLVSYRVDIKNWIEKCLEKISLLPIIRETLVQYLQLIKKLTNQTMNNDLKREITELIKNNFLEASEIAKNYDDTKNKLIADFWEIIKNSISTSINKNIWKVVELKIIDSYNYINIKSSSEDCISFYCRYSLNSGEINYGIILKKEMQKSFKGGASSVFDELKKESIESIRNYKSGPQSVIIEKENDWNLNNPETLKEIYQNEFKIKDEIIKKMNEFIEINEKFYNDVLVYVKQQINNN